MTKSARWQLDAFETERKTEQAKRLRLTRQDIPESAVLQASVELLQRHPSVQWVHRMNVGKGYLVPYRVARRLLDSGALKHNEARWLEFGFPGCSDILGQLKDGRLLAVECKRKGGKVRDEQRGFVDNVNEGHGVGMIITDPVAIAEALRR